MKLAGALADEGSAPATLVRPERALTLFAAVAAALLVPLGLDVLSLQGLVRACSASFVAVYVLATAAGVRLLTGAARRCAGVALAAVVVVLAFSAGFLIVPAVVAVAALALSSRVRLAPRRAPARRPARQRLTRRRTATAVSGLSAKTPSTPSS